MDYLWDLGNLHYLKIVTTISSAIQPYEVGIIPLLQMRRHLNRLNNSASYKVLQLRFEPKVCLNPKPIILLPLLKPLCCIAILAFFFCRNGIWLVILCLPFCGIRYVSTFPKSFIEPPWCARCSLGILRICALIFFL